MFSLNNCPFALVLEAGNGAVAGAMGSRAVGITGE